MRTLQMRADADVLHDEARSKLKAAMLSYAGDPVHVTIYILHQLLDWNDLQIALSRSSHPSRPSRVSEICKAVDDHLTAELKSYLGIEK